MAWQECKFFFFLILMKIGKANFPTSEEKHVQLQLDMEIFTEPESYPLGLCENHVFLESHHLEANDEAGCDSHFLLVNYIQPYH